MSTVAVDFNPLPEGGREVILSYDSRTSFNDNYKMDNNGDKFFNTGFFHRNKSHKLFVAHVGKHKNFSLIKGLVQHTIRRVNGRRSNGESLRWNSEHKVYTLLSEVVNYSEDFDDEIKITDSELIFGYKRIDRDNNESELYVWLFDDWSVINLSDYYAMGSGRKYALAILEDGGEPDHAVKIASKLDKSTGGEIQQYSLISNEKLKK